jgi:hypothetical protein
MEKPKKGRSEMQTPKNNPTIVNKSDSSKDPYFIGKEAKMTAKVAFRFLLFTSLVGVVLIALFVFYNSATPAKTSDVTVSYVARFDEEQIPVVHPENYYTGSDWIERHPSNPYAGSDWIERHPSQPTP